MSLTYVHFISEIHDYILFWKLSFNTRNLEDSKHCSLLFSRKNPWSSPLVGIKEPLLSGLYPVLFQVHSYGPLSLADRAQCNILMAPPRVVMCTCHTCLSGHPSVEHYCCFKLSLVKVFNLFSNYLVTCLSSPLDRSLLIIVFVFVLWCSASWSGRCWVTE